MERVICKNAGVWRDWLRKNHLTRDEVWLVFFKGERAKAHIDYGQALDEALCFGWIDNLVKRIDDEKYALRFVKRKEKSKWSPGNKARVEKLIKEDRLTTAGMAIVKAAKANGSWGKPDGPGQTTKVPPERKKAFAKPQDPRHDVDIYGKGQRKGKPLRKE